MKVFYGDNDDRDFSNVKKYAYLNWWFDDGCGGNQCPYQHIFDNYNMGKAFIGNALLTLSNIIESNNPMSVADKLIFPILFNSWHGLELWLKAAISSIGLMNNGKAVYITGHDIAKLNKQLENLLKNNGCRNISSISPVKNIIDEFERVKAHFDFARYSFCINEEFQFYNAPYKSNKQWQTSRDDINEDIVPNTCVDISNLFELLVSIFETFGSFVEYLTLCISEGEVASDKSYYEYLKLIERSDESLVQCDSQDVTNSFNIIVKEIMS